jgi:hypothetical protein
MHTSLPSSAGVTSESTHYDTLGIESTSSKREVKNRFYEVSFPVMPRYSKRYNAHIRMFLCSFPRRAIQIYQVVIERDSSK